jgi:hypothetical protein
VDDEFPTHNAVCLGVSSALESARLPQQTHLLLEAVDDGVNIGLLVGNRALFSDFQPSVGTPQINEGRRQACQWIAQHRIKYRAEEGIEAAFQMHEGGRGPCHPI